MEAEDCQVESSLQFGHSLTASLSQLLAARTLCDATLVCSDGSLAAHRVVLAASSPWFLSVFSLASVEHAPRPVVYLRGVPRVLMRAILHFLYTGVANVTEEEVEEFIKIATDLQIEGLMMNNSKKQGRKRKVQDQKANADASGCKKGKHLSVEDEESRLKKIREKYAVNPICLDPAEEDNKSDGRSSPPPSPSPLLSRQCAVKRSRKRKLKASPTKTPPPDLVPDTIGHSLEHDGASSGQGHHRPGYNAQEEEEELQNLTDTVVTATGSAGESRDTRSSLYQQRQRLGIYPKK